MASNTTSETDKTSADSRLSVRKELADLAAALHIRASDVEPFTGLRYLSKLFKFMGVILGLLIISEIVTGLVTQGSAAIPTLLNEVSRLLVFAGLLWGAGDLALLLIDVGHDVRASRILLSRIAHETAPEVGPNNERRTEKPVVVAPSRVDRPADMGDLPKSA